MTKGYVRPVCKNCNDPILASVFDYYGPKYMWVHVPDPDDLDEWNHPEDYATDSVNVHCDYAGCTCVAPDNDEDVLECLNAAQVKKLIKYYNDEIERLSQVSPTAK